MRRQSNPQSLDRVYRQFSRQRYKKYRSQFPKLYESEIVFKIIRQWEAMTPEEKQTLGAHYIRRNYISADQEKSNSNNSSLQKTPLKPSKLELMNTTASKLNLSDNRKTTTNLTVSRFIEEESDFNRYSERPSGDSHSEPSSPKALEKGLFNKRSRFTNHRHYISFFKYYYRKLSIEHKRWSAIKISSIIKLLWKREQIKNKSQKTKKISKTLTKETKYYSSRALFSIKKKKQGHNSKEIAKMWKRLPKDSRTFMSNPIATQNKLHSFIARFQAEIPTKDYEKLNPLFFLIHQKIE